VEVLRYLFRGDQTDCLEALDADDDFVVGTTDAIYLLNHLFLGGDPPLPPYPEEGEDPEAETLGCDRGL
jgi:hypothetical protein